MFYLNKGDIVALLNLGTSTESKYLNQQTVLRIKKYLENKGFIVKNLVIFGDIEHQIRLFNSCFASDEIKFIFPLNDGKIFTALDGIDYSLISMHPKCICGFSGLSAFLLSVVLKSKIKTFYGPHINFISDSSSRRENMFTIYSFWNFFLADNIGSNRMSQLEKYYFFKYSKDYNFQIYRNIYSSGKTKKHNYITTYCKDDSLVGNLYISTLEPLLWLCMEYKLQFNERYILMLDIFDMDMESILKNIAVLKRHLDFKLCQGLIISTICQCKSKNHLDEIELLLDKIHCMFDKKINLLYGFPIGHSRYKLTLPIGCLVRIDKNSGNIMLLEKVLQ